MVILRFRSESGAKDMLKKVKKMYKFTKELKDCLEENIEDDDDEDYRYEDEDEDERREMMENRRNNGGSYRRYRKSM